MLSKVFFVQLVLVFTMAFGQQPGTHSSNNSPQVADDTTLDASYSVRTQREKVASVLSSLISAMDEASRSGKRFPVPEIEQALRKLHKNQHDWLPAGLSLSGRRLNLTEEALVLGNIEMMLEYGVAVFLAQSKKPNDSADSLKATAASAVMTRRRFTQIAPLHPALRSSDSTVEKRELERRGILAERAGSQAYSDFALQLSNEITLPTAIGESTAAVTDEIADALADYDANYESVEDFLKRQKDKYVAQMKGKNKKEVEELESYARKYEEKLQELRDEYQLDRSAIEGAAETVYENSELKKHLDLIRSNPQEFLENLPEKTLESLRRHRPDKAKHIDALVDEYKVAKADLKDYIDRNIKGKNIKEITSANREELKRRSAHLREVEARFENLWDELEGIKKNVQKEIERGEDLLRKEIDVIKKKDFDRLREDLKSQKNKAEDKLRDIERHLEEIFR